MTDKAPIVVVIPARLESQRLPGKLLLRETGKPLIQHTYEAACRAKQPDAVYVATDSPEIADVVNAFGGRVLMTAPGLRSGTDRVAAAMDGLPSAQIVVNVQGDEPEIQPATIDSLIELMTSDNELPMATMATPIRDWETFNSASCVKVVRDCAGNALYFSRAAIPFLREPGNFDLHANAASLLLHLGIYAYRREFLQHFVTLHTSTYEGLESLEQLRAMEAGFKIRIGIVESASSGIDTQHEYDEFVRRIATQSKSQLATSKLN